MSQTFNVCVKALHLHIRFEAGAVSIQPLCPTRHRHGVRIDILHVTEIFGDTGTDWWCGGGQGMAELARECVRTPLHLGEGSKTPWLSHIFAAPQLLLI